MIWTFDVQSYANGTGPTIHDGGTKTSTGGLLAGRDWQISDTASARFMAGYVTANLDSGTDTDVLILGLSGQRRFGNTTLDFGFSTGPTRHNITRRINDNLAPGGIRLSQGNASGWYFSPEVALSHSFATNSGWKITPRASLRYNWERTGAYTETSTGADISVAYSSATSAEVLI